MERSPTAPGRPKEDETRGTDIARNCSMGHIVKAPSAAASVRRLQSAASQRGSVRTLQPMLLDRPRSLALLTLLGCLHLGAPGPHVPAWPNDGDLSTERLQDASSRLFRLGDYAGAERLTQELLSLLPAGASAERASCIVRRAELRILQGAVDEAVADIGEAAALADIEAVHRSAVFVLLRAQRYEAALPHAEALLRQQPDDRSARLARGICRARCGSCPEAIADLSAGVDLPGGRREALLERAMCLARGGDRDGALADLVRILEADPFDAAAVYQMVRQLLARRAPGDVRRAATLQGYFETLRELEGPSSRDRHLDFAGKPVEAALERALTFERLGRYDRMLEQLERARELGASTEQLAERSRGFLARQGLDQDASPDDLRALLSRDVASRDGALALRAARLLLAREPSSREALTYLAAASSDPALVVPRLHYVTRLAALDSGDAQMKATLRRLREALRGPGSADD